MKICITQLHSSRHLQFYLRLAEYLSENGLDVCFVTNKAYLSEKIKIYGYECGLLSDVAGQDKAQPVNHDERWLDICNNYNIEENLDKFIHVEWVQNKYYYYSKDELKSTCIKKFEDMKRIHEELKYDYVIQALASEIDRRIIHYFSKSKAQSFYYHVSLLPERQFMFCSNEFGLPYLGFDKKQTEIQGIEDLRRLLLLARSNNKYLRKVEDKKDKLRSKITNFRKTNFVRYLKSRLHRLLDFEIVILRKFYERFRRADKIGFTASELKGKEYIFYTVHQPAEAQTIVRGYHNIDELELLRIICHSLPPTVQLVAKLHPRVEHCYSNNFLKNLQKIPNLIIAKSNEDSIVLASNSKGVLTISSSIWMECLLMNIPCFTFGKGAFDAFQGYPYRVKIDTVKSVVASLNSDYERDRVFDERLVKSIYSNSFFFERNALSKDVHRHLGSAIIKLCLGSQIG